MSEILSDADSRTNRALAITSLIFAEVPDTQNWVASIQNSSFGDKQQDDAILKMKLIG